MHQPTIAGDFGRGLRGLASLCIRLPAFLLLSILQPLVTFALSSLALLCVLTACFWKLVGPPHFPFLLMLCAGLGLELLLVAYHALLRLVVR